MCLRNIFTEMDADGDGVLTVAELHNALLSKGLRIQDAQAKVRTTSLGVGEEGKAVRHREHPQACGSNVG
jgi:Ca2+-binding EF-hand superfamily protein